MSEIKKLYYNIDSSFLVEMPETKEASDRLYKEFGDDFRLEHEDTITKLTSANEKQGFICGFQYAVRLLIGGNQTFNRESINME